MTRHKPDSELPEPREKHGIVKSIIETVMAFALVIGFVAIMVAAGFLGSYLLYGIPGAIAFSALIVTIFGFIANWAIKAALKAGRESKAGMTHESTPKGQERPNSSKESIETK